MLPKPVRKLLVLFALSGVSLYGYDAIHVHTSQEVIAFKQYASAILEGDARTVARMSVDKKDGLLPLKKCKKRNQALRGDIKFTYYSIKDVSKSADGKVVTLSAQQITRLDPPGTTSIFGLERIVNNQQITLEADKSAWKVKSYRDDYCR